MAEDMGTRRLLRTLDGDSDQRLRGRTWSLLCRAPHHHGSRDVGFDHAASLEPERYLAAGTDIRLWEQAKGDGIKRVYEREFPVIRTSAAWAPWSTAWSRRILQRAAWRRIPAVAMMFDGVLSDGGLLVGTWW